MTTTKVWLPPGDWYEESTGVVHSAKADTGSVLTKAYDISETPVFVRAGAIIPTVPLQDGDTIGVASRQYTDLEFNIYPGATSGSVRVYEDDGNTTAYLTDGFAYLNASYAVSGSDLTFSAKMDTVGSPTDPSVTPTTRSMTLRIKSASAPAKVR